MGQAPRLASSPETRVEPRDSQVARSCAHAAEYAGSPVEDVLRLHRHHIDAAVLRGALAQREHPQFGIDTVNGAGNDLSGVRECNLSVILPMNHQQRTPDSIKYALE